MLRVLSASSPQHDPFIRLGETELTRESKLINDILNVNFLEDKIN